MIFKDIFTLTSDNKHLLFSVGASPRAILPESATWFTGINKSQLDNYLYINASSKRISRWMGDTRAEAIDSLVTILNANEYMLNGLYESMFLEYDPLVNYDRTETQTHNEQVQAGEHKATNVIGARSQTNTNGSRIDSTTANTTAFDSADYGKATDSNTNNYGASTDTINMAGATDTSTQEAYTDNSNGGYTLKVKGNIGVTTSQQMLESERQVKEFNFYAKLLDVIYKEFLNGNWEV